ncbi:39S ribosomal protein L38, mitochondrial [Aphelenchoides fujianensis]|nr:39S ribosomal protein L38, mitochondrial [Aphelenchoides fujianensis]
MKKVRSIFGELYVQGSYRAKRTPRVNRPWRPRAIAWAGPAAFYQTSGDQWYKARIQYPEQLPEMYVIEPTDYYRSLAERLEDEKKAITPLDIGFAKPPEATKKNPHTPEELERLARRNELLIDIEGLERRLARDHPPLRRVRAALRAGRLLPQRSGRPHRIRRHGRPVREPRRWAERALKPPTVHFGDQTGGFTTLLMVNLDGNAFSEADPKNGGLGHPQLVHWLVANVADGAGVADGQEVVPYLQPIPFHGTGFHRVAFVCFRHKEKIDAGEFQPKGTHLSDRVFNTNEFLKKFEETITPSALRFCQMEWHESCDETLKSLGMKPPRFWYEWNAPLKPEQKEFPIKTMPFDQYLDMYRDPREVEWRLQREWLERRVHEGEVKPAKFPDVHYAENKKALPHWIHRRLMDKNVGQGAYARLYSDFQNPAFQSRSPAAQ